MPSTWVYLARHGEVLRAAERRFVGHTDVALSPAGLAQVAALGGQLGGEPIGAIYASDLLRARQSAAPLGAARGVAVVTVPALREVAMGRWEGLTFAEIAAQDPARCARWLADPVTVPFPDGESLADLRARTLPVVHELLARHAGGVIAIVAHGGPNRVILAEALGLGLAGALRLAQDYAAWSLLEYRAGGAVLHALNRRPGGAPGLPPGEARRPGGAAG
jgi:alpha-ribazole phosphatase